MSDENINETNELITEELKWKKEKSHKSKTHKTSGIKQKDGMTKMLNEQKDWDKGWNKRTETLEKRKRYKTGKVKKDKPGKLKGTNRQEENEEDVGKMESSKKWKGITDVNVLWKEFLTRPPSFVCILSTAVKEECRTQNPLYLSMSVSRDESRKPLANGLLSIFSLVIWEKHSRWTTVRFFSSVVIINI